MKRPNKHILIGGGSGFIGTALSKALTARGDRVTILSRFAAAKEALEPNRITWNDLAANGLPDCDAVVNLAGKHILDMRRRWTPAYRNEVITSRTQTTEALVQAMNRNPPNVFISTAGKCFYGTREIHRAEDYPELDETSEPMAMDFPAELVRQWEAAADGLDHSRIRHVRMRIGIVLASPAKHRFWPFSVDGSRGILPLMRLPFSLGLGARIGSGIQPFPWIHIDDMVQLLIAAIDNQQMQGRYNAVAPGIVSNHEFSRVLANQLGRPLWLVLPGWLVKAVVGSERASILLQGQRVTPRRTLQAGFRFQYPDIDSALTDLVKNKGLNEQWENCHE